MRFCLIVLLKGKIFFVENNFSDEVVLNCYGSKISRYLVVFYYVNKKLFFIILRMLVL